MSACAVDGSRCAVGSSRRRTGAPEKGAREHEPLALTAGEHRPLFPDARVQAGRERDDPLAQPRALNEGLRFEVVDDGPGFEPDGVRPGAGLTNMRDRLAAVGSELLIASEPGVGTTVSGTIPLSTSG